MIKEYTRDISNICVSTFVISERFWRLINTWKIYRTLYVNFHTLLFNNIMIIIDDIYDIITTYGSLFMPINIRRQRINSYHYLLANVAKIGL